MRATPLTAAACLLFAWIVAPLAAAEPSPEGIEFFERKIRPLLATHCYECHGGGASKGGLSLESQAGVLRGGVSGALIVPGKPDESLLIEVIRHQSDIKMPPRQKLPDAAIADLTDWVRLGAPWPATDDAAMNGEGEFRITPEQRAFWAFQPVSNPAIPAVKASDWPRTSIDHFIQSKLEGEGLKPVPPADKRTLLRRATFDLIGLPPTPEEVQAFLEDDSPEAFARVIDRLLASPHYGERWGRYWLDVARYGEDQAHTFQARLYPQGFRYRDWVVKALNDDMPYDRFIEAQIAGDLMEELDEKERLVAVGYFALGPVYYADAGCAPKAAADQLDDRVDTLTRGFLGLTVSCARCHDHKFDPISQKDYYALAGVFRSTDYREVPLAPPEVVDAYNQAQAKIKEQEQAVNRYLDESAREYSRSLTSELARYLAATWKLQAGRLSNPSLTPATVAKAEGLVDFILDRCDKSLALENKGKIPQLARWHELQEQLLTSATSTSSADEVPAEVLAAAADFQQQVQAILAEQRQRTVEYEAKLAAATSEEEKKKLPKPNLEKPKADLLNAVVAERGLLGVQRNQIERLLKGEQKEQLKAIRAELDTLRKNAPPKYDLAHSLTEGKPADMPVYIRGNPEKAGETVPRRFLSILADDEPQPFDQGSGRRQLARAIASADNPLTARVMVNRVWQHHFGRGLVGTPSNFGQLGERPTHPELLDHLASAFVAEGWSLKALHRRIMLSATYQLSTRVDAANYEKDPDNRLLWRMNRRRLDVEAWRDALLAVSGNLDLTLGGPSGNLADSNYRRRTFYGAVSRHDLNPLLRLFDFPDPNITSDRRTSTTVPLQQLFILNSDFLVQQARALAKRVNASGSSSEPDRIRSAFLLLFGREPSEAETELGLVFLQAEPFKDDSGKPLMSQLSPWEQYAQVLLSANEFLYID